MSGLQTLVRPEEELRSADAIATLVSAWTTCANRSKGSGVGVEAEGIGESSSGISGGLGEGGLLSPPPPPLPPG